MAVAFAAFRISATPAGFPELSRRAVGEPGVTFALDGAPEVVCMTASLFWRPPSTLRSANSAAMRAGEWPAEHFRIKHMVDRINASRC